MATDRFGGIIQVTPGLDRFGGFLVTDEEVVAPQFGGMESAAEIPGQEFAGGMGVQMQ